MNSMFYWYPKIKDLKIPQPKTVMLYMSKDLDNPYEAEKKLELWRDRINQSAAEIGYPLFLRTDQASAKHNWKNSAYVANKDKLSSCVFNTLEFNYCADMMGLPVLGLVFREYIEMDAIFTAFSGEMPVNPEIRFFIKDGKVLCEHWYWIEDAIRNASCSDWKDKMRKKQEKLLIQEYKLLNQYAETVAKEFEGYWSVDFCRGKDGTWYLIDMARGAKSWHPECDKKLKTNFDVERVEIEIDGEK